MEDGLPDQEIQAVTQTGDQFLWLGTPHGLIRFDGFHFHEELRTPVFRQFGVSCLAGARNGDLWAGAYNGGVVRFHRGEAHLFGPESGLTSLAIRTLYEDADATLWVGTEHGLFRFTGDRFDRVTGVGEPSVLAIVADGAGGIWLGGRRLLHFQHGRFTEVHLPILEASLHIRSLALGRDGVLWIGTSFGLLKRSPQAVVEAVHGTHAEVRALWTDHLGRLWVGTVGGGLSLLDPRDLKLNNLAPELAPNGRIVLSFYGDHENNLWVGTQAGLTRLSDTGMTLWRPAGGDISDASTVSIDRDRSVLLSSGSVTRFSEGAQRPVSFPFLGSIAVRATLRDTHGALWIGTRGQGAYRLHDGRVDRYSAVLGSNFVRGFLEDDDGAVWIATDSGIARWQDGRVVSFQRVPQAPHQPVLSLATTGDGGLWVGTARGLFRLQKGRYQQCAVCQRIGLQRVWSLHRDVEGLLWIGTETHGYLLAGEGLHVFSLPDCVTGTCAVLSLLEDARGRMLIAEPGTIYRFDRSTLKQTVLSGDETPLVAPESFAVARETGAALNGGYPANAVVDAWGGAVYATYLGLVHLSPQPTALLQEQPPPALIEQVRVDGVLLPAGTHTVTLQPAAHLQIEATAIGLSARPGLQLQSRLRGFEPHWSNIEPGGVVSYFGLPGGHYRFEVASHWLGKDRVAMTGLDVVQQSPVWLRPWFFFLALLTLPALAWLWHRVRVQQLSLRFQAVSEERGRVAREIHDTLLQGCIGVSSLLEAVTLTGQAQHPTEERLARTWSTLEYARRETARTIEEARAAIADLRRTEELRELGADLERLVREQAHKTGMQLRWDAHGPALTLRPSVQHELFMATREAVYNAVAHAEAICLRVDLRTSPSRVVIEVSDDGKGFDPVEQARAAGHFGLVSMQERLRRVGGSVDIHSEHGKGSSVRLTLPLRAGMLRKAAAWRSR